MPTLARERPNKNATYIPASGESAIGGLGERRLKFEAVQHAPYQRHVIERHLQFRKNVARRKPIEF